MTTALRRATGLILAGLFAVACGGSPAATVPGSAAPTLAPGRARSWFPTSHSRISSRTRSVAIRSMSKAPRVQASRHSSEAWIRLRFNQFLTDIGATIDKVSAASTFGLWPPPSEGGEATGLTTIALRVRDIPAATTMQNLQTVVRGSGRRGCHDHSGNSCRQAGASRSADPEDPQDIVHLYGIGDIVLMIGGTPAYVEEWLATP